LVLGLALLQLKRLNSNLRLERLDDLRLERWRLYGPGGGFRRPQQTRTEELAVTTIWHFVALISLSLLTGCWDLSHLQDRVAWGTGTLETEWSKPAKIPFWDFVCAENPFLRV
jgi:hypothetical protein